MPFQWKITYELINQEGMRLATCKCITATDEAEAVALAFLRMFADVVEVRVTETASAEHSHTWSAQLGADGIIRNEEFDYG